MTNWLENSQRLLQQHFPDRNQKTASHRNHSHLADDQMSDDLNIDEKVVQTIVSKLGYSEDEVKKYVTTDKNSFVGVLY